MKPRKHQQDALSKIVPALAGIGTRATVAMACGSGKTLVGVRAIEAVLANNETAKVIVFVPNLPLLDQITNDWVELNAFGGDFVLLPVASTGSSLYGEDSVDHLEGISPTTIAKATKKLDVRANTTTSGVITETLKENRRVVIFATYQSSLRVADAIMDLPGFAFDAALMDEAHRTAGSGKALNSPWQMCLDDEYVPSERRLFMTATPRVHKARKSAKSQKEFSMADDILEEYIDHGVSMDDESVYGPLVYEYSFAEAIAANILSDYKIYAVAISDKDIRSAARTNRKVNLDHVDLQHPDPSQLEAVASARNLAVIAAVGKMVERGLVSGMLSFHSDTMRSRRFAKDASGYLASHPSAALSSSLASHVAGTTSQQDRQSIMNEFDLAQAQGRFATIANCAVLTEGFDLPELNSILFADPKHSKISIVQAAGRAIRLNPKNKDKVASIIIPVFIEDQEDPEDMVNSSAFGKLHEIILALRENDNMSAYFSDAIKNGASDKEYGADSNSIIASVFDSDGALIAGPQNGEDTPIVIIAPESAGKAEDMPATLVRSYRRFAKSCQSKIVGQYATPFERNLAKLRMYKELHGHCSMGPNAKIVGFPIGKVMNRVRDQFDLGNLPEFQREAYVAEGHPLRSIDELSALVLGAISAHTK